MDGNNEYAIGLDLGGTKILAALVDSGGTIVERTELKTPAHQGEGAISQQINAAVGSILEKNIVRREQILGVGIATAGVIDTDRSMIVQATNLGLSNAPIGKWIQDETGYPVRLGNDASVAAVGEWLFGAGREHKDLIYVTVSTGIGAGIISDGHLIKGVGDSAGEFGHISIEPEGPVCACGNRGCLENYSSGTALVKWVKQQLDAGETSGIAGDRTPSLTSVDIAKAASAGDNLAIRAFERLGYYLGVGLTNMIHIFNPELIILGGGVMHAGELVLPAIERTIEQRCIPNMRKQVRIEKSLLGSEAGIKGAAGLMFA